MYWIISVPQRGWFWAIRYGSYGFFCKLPHSIVPLGAVVCILDYDLVLHSIPIGYVYVTPNQNKINGSATIGHGRVQRSVRPSLYLLY